MRTDVRDHMPSGDLLEEAFRANLGEAADDAHRR